MKKALVFLVFVGKVIVSVVTVVSGVLASTAFSSGLGWLVGVIVGKIWERKEVN